MGFRSSVSLLPAIQATGLPTLTPAGLTPAEHASLSWTHNRTCRFPASGSRTRTHAVFRVRRHRQLLNISGVDRFPISMSFATCCVCLELRSLPSTGVTRLPRYYEPLRHPRRPACPSRASGWSVIPDRHALGLPVLRALSLWACCRQYPGAAAGRRLRSSHPAVSAFPEVGRVGLHIDLFEACSAFTRVAACTLAPSPIRDPLHRRLQPFRYLHDCSGCFRLERSPGGACTHWKAPPCHGARKKRSFPDRVSERVKST